jgi:hypothetical protein
MPGEAGEGQDHQPGQGQGQKSGDGHQQAQGTARGEGQGSEQGQREGEGQHAGQGAGQKPSQGPGGEQGPQAAGEGQGGKPAQETSGAPHSGQSGEPGSHSSGAGSPRGGGGNPQGGSPGSDEKPKDESKPSPRSQEPENQFADDVAPKGQPQSDLSLRKLTDVLRDEQSTKELQDRTGLTREQLEQFARKFEKPKAGPAGPGREIEVKPGDQTPAKPAANLPGVSRTTRFSTSSIRERGFMPQDNIRDNVEGLRFQPPPELRAKWQNYQRTLGKSAVTAPKRTAAPNAATGP